MEQEVLSGFDLKKYKPWIVVVEATIPGLPTPSFEKWQPLLTTQGYTMVYFDGVNRFYLAKEMGNLRQAFTLPPNVWDDFVTAKQIAQQERIAALEAEIDGLKNRREWGWTTSCTVMKGKAQYDFCQKVHALNAELASGQEATKLGAKVAELTKKLEQMPGGGKATEGDPQAVVLLQLLKKVVPNASLEDVQTTLSIFVALLLEIGSGFGMYVAFSQWRLYDRDAPAAPAMATVMTRTEPAVAQSAAPAMVAAAKPRVASANDNKTAPKLIAPETDVERFYKERIDDQDGSSLTATGLYEDYCAWCEEQQKEPLALPTFGREFGELGVQKAKIAGRVRYIGIALRSGAEQEGDNKIPLPIVQAA